MLLQYRVIYWGVRLASIISLLAVVVVLFVVPAEQRWFDVVFTASLAVYYFFLQWFAIPKTNDAKRIDLFSTAFLLPPMLYSSIAPLFFETNGNVEVTVGLIVFGSMCYVSQRAFIGWVLLTFGICMASALFVNQKLSGAFWVNLLLVGPGLAFIVRIVIQTNYNSLLERLQYEDRLTSELASTADELEIVKRFQKQSQQDLNVKSLHLTSVLSRAPVILLAMDKNGVCTRSRGRGLEKLGLQENELVGQQFAELYREQPGLVAAFNKAMAGENSQVRVSLAPGLTHEIQYGPIFDLNNQLIGVVGVGVDVSESVQADQRQRELELQLSQAQKMESLGALASGVAHDFNNYLSAIIAFCESLELRKEPSEINSAEYQTIVGEITKTAENASGVCEQILMFAGKSTQKKISLDLSELIREDQNFLNAVVSKETKLETDLSESPVRTIANRLLIQQAVVNLVKNSSDALSGRTDGRIDISVKAVQGLAELEQHSVRIGGTFRDNQADDSLYAVLSVEDNGPGVPTDDLKRIFEPYFSSKHTGHGLGLAITIGVVGNHGGVIYCRSSDKGTKVDLVFRLDENSVEPAVVKPTKSTSNGNESWRLLLVDDELSIVKSVQLAFSHFGHEMRTVSSGKEALALLDAGEEFDCLVLDYSMPNMNGLELLRAIRERGVKTPSVMCSGFLDLPAFGTVAPDTTLRKPYTISRLRDTISELCHREPV